MSDGVETLDQAATAEVQQAPVQDEPVNLDAPIEGQEAEAEVVEEELHEIDFGDKKYKVPKELKDGFLMQSDYTKKTQEVAEQRKALQAAQESAKQQAEADRAHQRDIGRVLIMNDQLAEYEKLNWQQLEQDDPFKAQALFREYSLLKNRRDGQIAQIQANEHERSQKAQQDFAKRYAETNDALAKDITGWNDDLANKLSAYAKASGVTDEHIRIFAVNPSLVKLLHKAFVGDQLIAAKQTQAKNPQTPIKPLPKVNGGGARSSFDPATADMEAYAAGRKKQGFVGRR